MANKCRRLTRPPMRAAQDLNRLAGLPSGVRRLLCELAPGSAFTWPWTIIFNRVINQLRSRFIEHRHLGFYHTDDTEFNLLKDRLPPALFRELRWTRRQEFLDMHVNWVKWVLLYRLKYSRRLETFVVWNQRRNTPPSVFAVLRRNQPKRGSMTTMTVVPNILREELRLLHPFADFRRAVYEQGRCVRPRYPPWYTNPTGAAGQMAAEALRRGLPSRGDRGLCQ